MAQKKFGYYLINLAIKTAVSLKMFLVLLNYTIKSLSTVLAIKFIPSAKMLLRIN